MKKNSFICLLIFFVALAFRFQTLHVPFWVDEFSSANQALLLQKFGPSFFFQHDRYAEPRNFLTHFLIALSFQILGQSEFSARLPTMIFGAGIPVLVYLLTQQLDRKNLRVSVLSSAFSITSYFLITWSRQARGYSLQVFLLLGMLVVYFRFLDETNLKKKQFWFIWLLCVGTLGLLTHITFCIPVLVVFLHILFIYRKKVTEFISWKVLFFLSGIGFLLVLLMTKTLAFSQIVDNIRDLVFKGLHNNLSYYHSFLWWQYALVSCLGALGLGILLRKNFRKTSLLIGIQISYLVFFCFLFGPVVSRYILPVFIFLLVGMAVSVDSLAQHILAKPLMSYLICCVIILNGHKFDFKPNQFYSVNHDFREIALIDYDQVYSLIKQKGALEQGKTAVIDTWTDRLEWYLGLDFNASYTFRWEDAGEMKRTPYTINALGEKVVQLRPQTKLISNLADLQVAMKKYPKGFIWIDDSSMSPEVIEYVTTHFKKELFLDHYPLDDNPYSIWPGTLYSWGL